MRKRKKSYKKELFLKILLLLGTLIAFAFFLELSIRIFFPQQLYTNFEGYDDIISPSNITPWKLNPGANIIYKDSYGRFIVPISINQVGLRGPELKERTDNTKRILVMGGSFTFGYGVSEFSSYPRLTESCLNKEAALRQGIKNYAYEVLNGGWAGTRAPDAQYVYLKNNINRLDPDIVVWEYVISTFNTFLQPKQWAKNDSLGLPIIIEPQKRNPSLLKQRLFLLVKTPPPGIRLDIHHFLLSHSHAYVLYYKIMRNIIIERDYPDGVFLSDTWSSQTQEDWAHFEDIIVATKKMLDERDIPLVIMIAESRTQLIEDNWDAYKSRHENENVTFNRLRPNNELMTICNKYNISCFDTYDDFILRGDINDLYLPEDSHWNEKGHVFISNILCSYLYDNHIVNG